MATQDEIGATYNFMDEFWRLSVGAHGDITAAMYEGDEHRTLEEAQAAKHAFILREMRIGPGSRILDIGCGWGGLLAAAKRAGATGTGLTLSTRQRDACVETGLDVRVLDWNDLDPETLGPFDAVVSVGAFEHFCSPEQCRAGEQLAVYQRFFGTCHHLLRSAGRLFVQTMLWGRNAPALDRVTLAAPRRSAEYLVASLLRFYPGSWLPTGLDQVCAAAAPGFALESHRSGRDDYIRTMREWKARTMRMSWRKTVAAVRLLPMFVTDRAFLRRIEVLLGDYNMKCFERGIMEHERMVFERLPVCQ